MSVLSAIGRAWGRVLDRIPDLNSWDRDDPPRWTLAMRPGGRAERLWKRVEWAVYLGGFAASMGTIVLLWLGVLL